MSRASHVLGSLVLFAACSTTTEPAPAPANGEADGDAGSALPAAAPDATGGGDPSKPSGDGGDAAADAGADASAPISYAHYDINHVLSTGQSDSVANGASPRVTSTQPFGNLSFDTGVMTGRGRLLGGANPNGSCDGEGCTGYETPSSFIPLVEGDSFLGYGVETMSSGLANQATVFASAWFAKVGLPPKQHDVLVSLHGRSGNTYWCLKKNPCAYLANQGYLMPFVEAMMQVTSAKALAAAAGKTYVVRAVTAIHGGSDHYDRENELATLVMKNDGTGLVGDYTEALIEWQHDYETSVQAITGQTEPVPLFVSQFGSWTDIATSKIPVRQLAAHVKAPGKVVVVTPNYPFVHYSDCLHYTNYSQRRLGAYFAKAYQRTVIEGVPFEPLRPISVIRTGATVTVKFLVPVPPMVIDTTRVTDPGNYGFTYADSTGSASIASVALAGPDAVTVTLSNAPTGANRKLRYALNAPVPAACPGPVAGARGNLRDSDATVAYHTDANGQPYELHNWAVHFEVDVP